MAEPTQIAYRTLKGIGLFDASPVYQAPSGFEKQEQNVRCSAYSPDGKFFAWATPDLVTVVDPSVGHVVTTMPLTNVYELGFSPLGTYFITWQRPTKDEDGNATKNLKVWRTIDKSADSDGDRVLVGQFVQKAQTGWNLQYTSDELFCARAVTNEVQFYQSNDLGTVWNKLRNEGLTDFAVAPGKEHSIAIFVPERKGQPAAVKVFNVPQFENVVSQKTFFKGDKVQLKWNNLGTSLIVLAQTDVDKSNRSYYGETNLYILSANGGFDSRIELDKEGPIHDVTWSPSSSEFGVVYGYMPAKTTIFNTRAVAKHSFSLGPRNTILFSPHGRYVLVAGFGNLAGQMDLYDLQKDYAKITTIEASNASACEWSPDGKHILTATTSPRLRVDNGIRIWHICGTLMYNEEMTELYDITWRPQSIENHPLGDPMHSIPAPHPSALEKLATVKTPSKPTGAYRPPGARGTTTPLHFKREDEGGSAFISNGVSNVGASSGVANGFGRPRRREVPGAEAADPNLPPGAVPGGGVSLTTGDDNEPLSKAALKNKKKREAKKAKDAAEKANGGLGDGTNGSLEDPYLLSPSQQRRERSRSRRPRSEGRGASPSPMKGSGPRGDTLGTPQRDVRIPSRNRQQQRGSAPPKPSQLQNAITIPTPPPQISVVDTGPLSPTTPNGGSPHERKVRALLKKLRAIEELKMRQAGGEKLELSQVSKIDSEDKVKKDLVALEAEGE